MVIFGQLLAVAAIIMSLAFVVVDLGRPDRFLHLIPGIGKMNFKDEDLLENLKLELNKQIRIKYLNYKLNMNYFHVHYILHYIETLFVMFEYISNLLLLIS